jgi:alkylation response protein AidB-like acyl-CoA dehydrogenase
VVETQILDASVQLHGATDLSHEHPISKMFIGARSHRMLMGTSAMQRMTILRALSSL